MRLWKNRSKMRIATIGMVPTEHQHRPQLLQLIIGGILYLTIGAAVNDDVPIAVVGGGWCGSISIGPPAQHHMAALSPLSAPVPPWHSGAARTRVGASQLENG
ncbi:hypothetical protein ACLKA7_009105 [Drosophila subpalustris]